MDDDWKYAIWRLAAWIDGQGSYIEIDQKVAAGELIPEWPYKSPVATETEK